MTSEGNMLTAVAREHSVIKCGVIIGFDNERVFQLSICFHFASPNVFVVLYNKSVIHWSLGKQLILLPSNLNVKLKNSNSISYLIFMLPDTCVE